MRELSKTFSKKYNFKRLLQTTPALSKLYNKREDAVNSIEPVKCVQIIDRKTIAAIPNSPVDMNNTVSLQIFGPDGTEWPRRIKYAEQVPGLYEKGYECTWVVKIKSGDSNAPWSNDTTWLGRVNVEVIRVSRPRVVTFYPEYKNYPPNIAAKYPEAHHPVNPDTLNHIDENKFVSFFLSDGKAEPVPLEECGIIPTVDFCYNTTFYDREVAHLYADSLRTRLKCSTSHSHI